MTAGRRHSTAFDVIEAIRDAIIAADWPPHADLGVPPDVGIDLDESPDMPIERVAVLERVEDDATIEWARASPAGRDERFLVDIVIDTDVPGQSRREVWDRLRGLAEVVQGVFYNPTTLLFTPPTDEDWWSQLGGVRRVMPRIWHVTSLEGWAGRCTITVAVATRI